MGSVIAEGIINYMNIYWKTCTGYSDERSCVLVGEIVAMQYSMALRKTAVFTKDTK